MSWPLNAVAGGTYVLKPTDQRFTTPKIVLPDNFTIKLPPDWPTDALGRYLPLTWIASDELAFGFGCVIDLSPQGPQLAKLAKGKDGKGGSRGEEGGSGENGSNGADGMSGADLLLYVKKWIPSGSLWIRTDGSNGGDGGDGGQGGTGGDAHCNNGFFDGSGPHGGHGGRGGDGGRGGRGGDTSRVQFEVASVDSGQALPIASCVDSCGNGAYQVPPPSNDGTIRIFGAFGCGGRSGKAGLGGPGGHGAHCSFPHPDRRAGNTGYSGRDGYSVGAKECFQGQDGRCRLSRADVLAPL